MDYNYICLRCLFVSTWYRPHCGVPMIGFSYKARAPRKNADRRVWKKFLERFVFGRVQRAIELSHRKKEEPLPHWLQFLEEWGGNIPQPSDSMRGSPAPLRLPWARQDAEVAVQWLEGDARELMGYAYGLDGKEAVERDDLADTLGYTGWGRPRVRGLMPKSHALMELLVPIAAGLRTEEGHALAVRLARLAEKSLEVFERVVDAEFNRISARMEGRDLLPLIRDSDPEVRAVGLKLIHRMKAGRSRSV